MQRERKKENSLTSDSHGHGRRAGSCICHPLVFLALKVAFRKFTSVAYAASVWIPTQNEPKEKLKSTKD